MAKTESKVQKVARGTKQQQKSAGVCQCGQELKWMQVRPQAGGRRMRRYCEACLGLVD